MKKFQILIIIFIILTLSGLMAGCACGYFTDKSDLDGSNIDNTDDIATNSSDNPGTAIRRKTGDGNDIINNPDTNSSDDRHRRFTKQY